jgi:type IV pilus assembly protein PilN
VWFLINTYYNNQIAGQQARNAFLDQEIAAVKTRITEIELLKEKRDKLLNRKKVIEELQANRSQMVHLFDSLVRTIPDGVVLTSIKQEGDKLTLEGRSQSNARVSTYMRNFETSGWMSKPELSVIQAEGDDKGLPYTFSLTVTLANPNAKKEDGEMALAADTAAAAAAAAAPATLQPLSPAQPATGAAPAAVPATPAPTAPAPAAGAPSSNPAESAQPQPSGGAES